MSKHLLVLSAAILSSALAALAVGTATDIDWPAPGPTVVGAFGPVGEEIDWP